MRGLAALLKNDLPVMIVFLGKNLYGSRRISKDVLSRRMAGLRKSG